MAKNLKKTPLHRQEDRKFYQEIQIYKNKYSIKQFLNLKEKSVSKQYLKLYFPQ